MPPSSSTAMPPPAARPRRASHDTGMEAGTARDGPRGERSSLAHAGLVACVRATARRRSPPPGSHGLTAPVAGAQSQAQPEGA
jgi:hypothetical protein